MLKPDDNSARAAQIGSAPADGLWRSVPISLAALGIGTASGALGVEYGLSVLEVAVLSALLFAGSAQFAFPTLYMGSLPVLVFTILYINIRHVVYSTALSLQARLLPARSRALIGAQLTDETFMTASTALESRQIRDPVWMYCINIPFYSCWITGNVAGALAAGAIDLTPLGFEFAPVAMFLCLLLLQSGLDTARHRQALVVALVAGGGSFALELFGWGSLGLLVLAPLAALAGAVVMRPIPDDEKLSSPADS